MTPKHSQQNNRNISVSYNATVNSSITQQMVGFYEEKAVFMCSLVISSLASGVAS